MSGRACPPPGGLQASDCTYPDKVRITWNAVPKAVKYQVFRAASSGGSKTKIKETTKTSHDDTPPQVNKAYSYWVKTCFDGECTQVSGFSQAGKGKACCDPPPAPANVRASDGAYGGKVVVTWDDAAGATTYEVYRAPSSSGAKTRLASRTATNYEDTSAEPSTTYHYWAKACNDCNCSDYSVGDTGHRGEMPAEAVPTYLPLVLR